MFLQASMRSVLAAVRWELPGSSVNLGNWQVIPWSRSHFCSNLEMRKQQPARGPFFLRIFVLAVIFRCQEKPQRSLAQSIGEVKRQSKRSARRDQLR